MEQKILEVIENAEMILVGIGAEFAPACPEFGGDAILEPFFRSRYYDELPEDHEVIRAYNRLRELIGARPYFVVTLNTDDLIYRSQIEKDLIVAPCGSMQKMQCGEHIVEAGAIRDAVLDTQISEDITAESVVGEKAVCPVCGQPVQFHTIQTEGYLEQGYLPQWEKYTKWLQCTLNRRLCILELGVDFRFPQVVRWPFEKVAIYNRKATLIRVNSRFPQLTEELSQSGISVPQSPLEFLE